ncbi:hypothetical protein KJZ71_02390 [Patescibacteria group bacterium]|uniref:Uncharacterized protein n=1 Tax=candidate division WWE3 bacterium TaxID=2053526 RepID=A0A928TUE7_UNCKA|nr:hypothetical protein [candidate division WWE3 bacterium]MCL4732637.1 hypothetical protein [Patescibacteria group bacterium]MDL1952709.1 hypothetical protein [Candidatus Uhrbacteria bacterium UHB]RIL01162.1 MAG: hypothetical protein DCC77_01305 [Candidatus Uhrbacteria bacterium]
MNLDTLNQDELYNELEDLARRQGVTSQDMWNELVDEVIDSHFNIGELEQDQDLIGLRDDLRAKWDVYQSESGEEVQPLNEDPHTLKR